MDSFIKRQPCPLPIPPLTPFAAGPGFQMACGALLPRALSGQEFLQASHFTLGPDVRLHADSRQATSHRHFPPHAAHPAPLLRPAPPRPPFLPAGPGAWARAPPVSESHCAFPSPPLQPQVARRALVQARTRAMQSSHVSAPGEADARAGRTGTSVAHACYRWLQGSPHARELILGARLIFDRDSVLKGDLSQPWRLPCTTNQEFFQPHHSCPQSRRAGRHLREPRNWGIPTLGRGFEFRAWGGFHALLL